jgi:hypothetical protein
MYLLLIENKEAWDENIVTIIVLKCWNNLTSIF